MGGTGWHGRRSGARPARETARSRCGKACLAGSASCARPAWGGARSRRSEVCSAGSASGARQAQPGGRGEVGALAWEASAAAIAWGARESPQYRWVRSEQGLSLRLTGDPSPFRFWVLLYNTPFVLIYRSFDFFGIRSNRLVLFKIFAKM